MLPSLADHPRRRPCLRYTVHDLVLEISNPISIQPVSVVVFDCGAFYLGPTLVSQCHKYLLLNLTNISRDIQGSTRRHLRLRLRRSISQFRHQGAVVLESRPHLTMFHRRTSLGGRKVSPPQPTAFTAEQKCELMHLSQLPALSFLVVFPTLLSVKHASTRPSIHFTILTHIFSFLSGKSAQQSSCASNRLKTCSIHLKKSHSHLRVAAPGSVRFSARLHLRRQYARPR